MSIKPRTIDNLGVDASIRYAKDQELVGTQFIEDSRLIPQKTAVTVATPYTPSEFDQIYSVGKTASWALFSPPPNYFLTDKGIFSYQLIPSLGDYEKFESNEDKIETLEDPLKKFYERSRQGQSDDGQEQNEKDRKRLLALFQCIQTLNKALTSINARRNQWQRG